MGEKLIEYFDAAKKLGGLSAIKELAERTSITSAKAYVTPDSSETIDAFETAMKDMRKHFGILERV